MTQLLNYNCGWVCPKCNRVYGPHVYSCDVCNSKLNQEKEPEFTCSAASTIDTTAHVYSNLSDNDSYKIRYSEPTMLEKLNHV